MKSPKQPFRPELERLMAAAREDRAATLFAPVTIKSLLSRAAGEGQAYCVVPAPLDMRETAAAQAIVAWCGREGLRADWVSRAAGEAHGEQPYDLVISWRPVPPTG